MNTNDVQVISGGGPVRVAQVDDQTTSSASTINPGEPIKKGGAGTNFAIILATGDPEVGTDEMLGIASKASTETSTADGEVEYHSIIPGLTVLRAFATTTANIDTAAELRDIIGDWVTFDLTSTTFTIDEDEGTDPNVHGLKIVDGNTTKGTLDVIVHSMATEAGTTV